MVIDENSCAESSKHDEHCRFIADVVGNIFFKTD